MTKSIPIGAGFAYGLYSVDLLRVFRPLCVPILNLSPQNYVVYQQILLYHRVLVDPTACSQ